MQHRICFSPQDWQEFLVASKNKYSAIKQKDNQAVLTLGECSRVYHPKCPHMLEALAIGIASNGLAAGASGGSEVVKNKVRRILRRKQFSEDVGILATEFNNSLKEVLSTTFDESNNFDEDSEYIKDNWKEIAASLDEIDVVFESNEEAVVRIADAIEDCLELSSVADLDRREAIETAVAGAYREAIRSFANEIAGTDLESIFLTETNIELTAATNRLDNRLASLQRRLREHEDAALRNKGFIRLDPLYFERADPIDPVIAWRTGFNFAEIAAGFPLSRQRPPSSDQDDRQSLTTEVLDRLTEDENVAVLGEGGSGKSTVCKQVAYQWQKSDQGSVFYRESGAGSFNNVGTLIKAVRAADDTPLIVTEDAVTEATKAIYRVIDAVADSDAVFLIDARRSEWKEATDLVTKARLEHHRQSMTIVSMPSFDKVECKRAVTHYESVINKTVHQTGEHLYSEVRNADIGAPLILAYYLTGPTAVEAESNASAFKKDVQNTYTEYISWAGDDRIKRSVAVLINVLNASGIAVEPSYIYSLGSVRDDFRDIERALERLEGSMIVGRYSENGTYRTPHEMWSIQYMNILMNSSGEKRAIELFEYAINAVFGLILDQEKRSNIEQWLRRETSTLASIDNNPVEMAEYLVKQVAQLGVKYPTIAPLYNTGKHSRIELPEICSTTTTLEWINRRGEMYFKKGNLEQAVTELNRFDNQEKEASESVATEFRLYKARNEKLVGKIKHDLANYSESRSSLQQAKEIFETVGNTAEQAEVMLWLGHVALSQSDVSKAKENYEQALTTLPDEATKLRADCYNALGLAAAEAGKLNEAQTQLEQSRDLYRTVENKRREAVVLNNRGFYHRHTDPDVAMEYLQIGLHLIEQTSGDYIKAKLLSNLSIVSIMQDNLNEADEYNSEALRIRRDMNDEKGRASSLITQGTIARERGRFNDARENIHDGLSILTDIDNKKRMSRGYYEWAQLELEASDYKRAEELAQKGLDAAEEIDNSPRQAELYRLFGQIRSQKSDTEESVRYLYRSLRLFESLDATWQYKKTISVVHQQIQCSDTASHYRQLLQHFGKS